MRPFNVRLDDETLRLLDVLAKRVVTSRAAIIRRAVRELSEREGVTARRTAGTGGD